LQMVAGPWVSLVPPEHHSTRFSYKNPSSWLFA